MKIYYRRGFTLVELLVAISIIGVILSISFFGIQNARKSSRDGKRKSDLEAVRSALEMYRSDNNKYPSTSTGMDLSSLPFISPNYISSIPTDPLSNSRNYTYACTSVVNGDCVSYVLCASLESGGDSVNGCGASCGSGVSCNYKISNP